MSRVLVTGFVPFGALRRNPSADLVRRLARDPACRAAGVRAAVLPVHRTLAPRELARLLARHRPEVLLLTGVAAGRDACCHELAGVNAWRSLRSPRGSAAVRILRGGPASLRSTLSSRPVLDALRASGLSARTSRSAGTFACNLVLYLALRWASHPPRGLAPHGARVAFLHLPATPESLPARPRKPVPTVRLERLARGVRALVLTLARGNSS